MGRKNRRKPVLGRKKLFLFGKLQNKKVVGICKYHSCYLSAENLAFKRCIKKRCKHLLLK